MILLSYKKQPVPVKIAVCKKVHLFAHRFFDMKNVQKGVKANFRTCAKTF